MYINFTSLDYSELLHPSLKCRDIINLTALLVIHKITMTFIIPIVNGKGNNIHTSTDAQMNVDVFAHRST